MPEWITDGIKWSFSGVGVAFLFIFLPWVIKKIKSRKISEPSLNGASLQEIIDAPPAPKQEPDIKATSLSPKKILDEINSAPLLQQQEISKQYIGIKVSWKGNLKAAQKIFEEENTIQIMIGVPHDLSDKDRLRTAYTSVFFEVDPEQYPGIGTLREEHDILVEGRIDKISGHITLKVEKLEFNIDKSD